MDRDSVDRRSILSRSPVDSSKKGPKVQSTGDQVDFTEMDARIIIKHYNLNYHTYRFGVLGFWGIVSVYY